jgi:hypothetical protein
MATIDPFLTDAFTLSSLTASINAIAYTPSQLGSSGLFSEDGITTTTAMVESDGASIGLVDVMPRNAPGKIVLADKRSIRSFVIPHLPERAAIMADEVQNIRDFGSENKAQTIKMIVDKRLAKMRRQIDYTIEAHRLSALKGLYYNAAGGTTSLFTEFGVSQQTVGMALLTSTTNIESKIKTILEYIESALDGIPYREPIVYCGSTFFVSMRSHANVQKTMLNSPFAQQMNVNPLNEFVAYGLRFVRYRGTSSSEIAATDAYVVPTGVPDLFVTRFAPANYMETVNTMGLPYYAKIEPMEMNKGVELEAQSNPINLCTRPAVVIKLTET